VIGKASDVIKTRDKLKTKQLASLVLVSKFRPLNVFVRFYE